MAIPLIQGRSLNLTSVLASDAIAIGFCKSESGEYTFPVATSLVRKIEARFEVALTDELDFFSATGKSGEINEIPVSATGARCERLILVGLGNQSLSDQVAQETSRDRWRRQLSGNRIDA